jgi:acylphosphatase
MALPRRVHVVVSGHVQGVFFRTTCEREARARGVAGWVRNRDDGSVEASFEGDADAVGAMVSWCRRGPPRASVTEIDVRDEAPTREHGFRVMG